ELAAALLFRSRIEHGQREADARERSADLVGKRRRQLLLALHQLAQSCRHGVEVAREAVELTDLSGGRRRLAIVRGKLPCRPRDEVEVAQYRAQPETDHDADGQVE